MVNEVIQIMKAEGLGKVQYKAYADEHIVEKPKTLHFTTLKNTQLHNVPIRTTKGILQITNQKKKSQA